MLSNTMFVEQSLTDHLFYLRTIREFCMNIQLSFFENNKNYADIAADFGKRCEILGDRALALADGKLNKYLVNTDSFVTKYTLDCELLTEKLFGVDINTNITEKELNLKPANGLYVDNATVNQVMSLNESALVLTQNFIDFCGYLLTKIRENRIFSYSYPLFYTYMIEESKLYYNDLDRLIQRVSADPTFMVNFEFWFSDTMIRASQFIIGFSDPTQTSIITNADNYRKIFTAQRDKYKNTELSPDSQINLNAETMRYVETFISFLSSLIEGVLSSELHFIVEPVFFDNLLTEANYFLYLLRLAEVTV